jgi:hypothetical protein
MSFIVLPNMTAFNEFQSDLEVLRQDGMLVIFLFLGAACFFYAIVLLGIAQPPNVSLGFPFFTVGISLWFYVLTRMSSIQSSITINKINQRLENIEQMVEKWDFD